MKTSFLILVFAGVAVAADTLRPRLAQLSANHNFAQNKPEIYKHNLAEAVVAETAPVAVGPGLNLAQLLALDASEAAEGAATELIE